jgi:hypothetical protein
VVVVGGAGTTGTGTGYAAHRSPQQQELAGAPFFLPTQVPAHQRLAGGAWWAAASGKQGTRHLAPSGELEASNPLVAS